MFWVMPKEGVLMQLPDNLRQVAIKVVVQGVEVSMMVLAPIEYSPSDVKRVYASINQSLPVDVVQKELQLEFKI